MYAHANLFDSETAADCQSAQLVCLSCPAFAGCQAGHKQLEMIAEEEVVQRIERAPNGTVTITQARRRVLTLRKG